MILCIIMIVVPSRYFAYLIVAVRRRFAEEQSRESELQGGGVAIDHLSGNVQEDASALLVRVV